jgi:hypothetical protein
VLLAILRQHSAAGGTDQVCRLRLQTDLIDLLQFHEVIRDDDPDRIFAAGDALEAVLEARKAGKIRYIGFTGHKSPDIHLKMLATASAHHFTFDTVQMPLNVMDHHFNSFEAKVLPVLQRQDIGTLGMKPMGDPFILQSKTVTAVECLHYAMNLPTSVVITGCDSLKILQQALDAARNFQPLGKEEVAALLAKTAKAAQSGEFERYKTSHHSTALTRIRSGSDRKAGSALSTMPTDNIWIFDSINRVTIPGVAFSPWCQVLYLGQQLAILAIQQLPHRLPPSLAHFTQVLALIGVHAALTCGPSRFGVAARWAAVGETRLIRLQLELVSADDADLCWESHLDLMIRPLFPVRK